MQTRIRRILEDLEAARDNLPAPDGRAPDVRTVWFVETGHDVPRFVTAYPLAGESDD